jgi:hypothetical protein
MQDVLRRTMQPKYQSNLLETLMQDQIKPPNGFMNDIEERKRQQLIRLALRMAPRHLP